MRRICGSLYIGENDIYFLAVLRYIHKNPLKAVLIKSIEE
jgi:hypothetical protein